MLKFLIFATGASLLFSCGSNPEVTFTPDPPEIPGNSADSKFQITKEWTAGSPREQNIAIETGFGVVSQKITLEQKPLTVETVSQINRPIQKVTAFQGHDGNQNSETFAASEAGLFDLLIVIDDSDSMDGYQQKLANSLPSILKHIGTTNWRIAVATTSDSCLRTTTSGLQILTKDFYEKDPVVAQTTFTELIDVGVRSSYERGILMAADALEGKCGINTIPWLRPQAQVSVLIVTDEQNCGSASNEGCSGEAWEKPSYLTEKFNPTPVVNGLLLLQDPPAGSDTSCENSGFYENPPNPSNYIDLILETGGIYDDICTSDYQRVLEQISQSVSDKINVQFELDYAPKGPLEVLVDGKEISDYFIDSNILTINEPIDEGAQNIIVNYKHSPISKTRFYSAGMGVDTKTLKVYLDGNLLGHGQYSFNENTSQVEFAKLPASRSKVDLVFRENIPLKKSFNFNQAFLEDSLVVRVNGVDRSDFTVDMPTRTISLETAPTDDAEVTFHYALRGDKRRNYDIVGPNIELLENFRVVDIMTGNEIEAQINADGQLQFPDGEIYNGREVKAEYNLYFDESKREFTVPVPPSIVPDSLSILAGDNPELCTKNITFSNRTIQFTCEDEDFETININFREIEDYQNTFTLDFDYAGLVRWEVFVNDLEFEKFHVFDKTVVILKEDLPPGSKVKIAVTPAG